MELKRGDQKIEAYLDNQVSERSHTVIRKAVNGSLTTRMLIRSTGTNRSGNNWSKRLSSGRAKKTSSCCRFVHLQKRSLSRHPIMRMYRLNKEIDTNVNYNKTRAVELHPLPSSCLKSIVRVYSHRKKRISAIDRTPVMTVKERLLLVSATRIVGTDAARWREDIAG